MHLLSASKFYFRKSILSLFVAKKYKAKPITDRIRVRVRVKHVPLQPGLEPAAWPQGQPVRQQARQQARQARQWGKPARV